MDPLTGNRREEDNVKIKEHLDNKEFDGDYYVCLDAAQAESGRFKAYRFLGQFALNQIWKSINPEDVLKGLFMMCLSYAMKGAAAINVVANHYIFLLTSRHLDYEIAVHFKNVKKIDNSMAERILTRFEIVDQSNKSKERPSLREEPFVIDITAIESKGLKKKMTGKGRSDFNISYHMANGSTYELQNADNLCLFRAFEFLRMKFELPQQRFSEYKRNERWQLENVKAMCILLNANGSVTTVSALDNHSEEIAKIATIFSLCHVWAALRHSNVAIVLITMPKLPIVKSNVHHKQKEHVCGHKFCKVCLGFHAPRECYIPYHPKVKKDKRIIFFDFECTTDFKPEQNLARFKHQVNFCYAHVTCTRCIEKGIWAQELDQACGICGPYRTYAWASFDFFNTEVECRFKVEDPLAAFTKWLLQFDAEVLGIEPNERGKKRKRPVKENNNNNNVVGFFDDEAEEENSDDNNDAENNYMLGDDTNVKQKSVTTYAYAHAGSRYDHVLIYGEMLRMGIRPVLIRQGNHLLEMKAQKRGVITTTIFRDSYKLIPIKLANFVKTFGLEIDGVENKKYFPHKFNKAANYGTVLETLPPIEDYFPGGLFPAERQKFEQWYTENRNTRFELCEVIADYCKTDVQILAHGMVKMRELFFTATDQELTDSITIPSACMKFFVFLAHENNERISIIPHMGYEKRGKQSTIARKYLKWRAEEEMQENGLTLRHVESPDGEFKFGNYLLDGMLERPGADKNLAIEVNGCYWHGCPNCFPDDSQIVGGGETAGAIRARDAKRIRDIAREFEVEILWECQLIRLLENDPAMKAFFDNTPDSGPIDFHDAFFGGRTGPEWLYASVINQDTGAQKGRTIKVKDFNSLYPSRNMFIKYPIGHPTKLKMDKDVKWTRPEHIVDNNGTKMEGIIKCFAVPPRHCLYDIPVLPRRTNIRTLFPLCRTCSEIYPNGKVDPNYNCPHFDEAERGFSTTVVHFELEAALRAGYKVTHIYSAYIWPLSSDWSETLFHPYLNKFLKIKFEASGYPANCCEEGINEEELEQRKQSYINNPWDGNKVLLNPNEIKPNPGLRYVSKLCLNSLWGRFALRNRLTKTEIVDCHAELAKLLNDDKIEISSIDQLTEKFWMVCSKAKDEHVVEHDTSNVVIALWTTAAARIHLLDSLQKVYEPAPGVYRKDTRILYMDTDSIFYDYETTLGDPLPSGQQLGELTDEYPKHTIMEFVCGEDEFKVKLRGITLDSDACEQMSFEKMKEMVLQNWGLADNNVRFNYPTKNFRITKEGEIFTVPLVKKFNPTVNKGVIRDEGLFIAPFGYSTWKYCRANNPNDCRCKHQ
ncbi:hypothetical protein niasHT_040116 [Heterodera trifolii]|uniref:DNA-directed DNA polymerase n=1 Tax=Heterodera trifolii TaxID=157864 RepID=A0ABD2I0U7_9BILA